MGHQTFLRNTLHTLLYIAVIAVSVSCTKTNNFRIGVSQCGSGQWREKVNREMLAAQHLFDQDVEVTIACAYDDTERQKQQIDSLAHSGIDLLVVAPNEAAPIADAIANVRKMGIPVIYFDRKATTNDYTAFIGGNNQEAGQTMGEYAAGLGESLFVMEITGAMSSSPAQERHRGFAQAMANRPEIRYVCKEGDWTSEKACQLVTEQIRTGEVPDAVFCHNDGMATGVYKAVVEQHVEGDVKILGIDGLPGEGIEYVQLGHQVGTYVYPTHGEQIVRLALDILIGNQYSRDNELQGLLVTPDNANIVDLNSRELMNQNENLITIEDKLQKSIVQYDTQQKILLGSLVAILLLLIGFVLNWVAYRQKRKNSKRRQSMNEEQVLFYTNSPNQQLHQIFDKPDDDLPPPNSQDMLFAESLNNAIRKHMSNPNLKMETLGDEIGLGRVQLYRKVKAITGQSPIELLRQMRLQRAYALLTSTTKTVSEIAFEVGFNTPGYFSKCFKEQYGKLPMDVRDSMNQPL